jgi:hypothetical protein
VHFGELWTHVANNNKKHHGNQRRFLIKGYSGLNTSSKKGVKTRMKTTISFYDKKDEVVT